MSDLRRFKVDEGALFHDLDVLTRKDRELRTCLTCGLVFPEIDQLSLHQTEQHSPPCKCGMHCSSADELLKHQSSCPSLGNSGMPRR